MAHNFKEGQFVEVESIEKQIRFRARVIKVSRSILALQCLEKAEPLFQAGENFNTPADQSEFMIT